MMRKKQHERLSAATLVLALPVATAMATGPWLAGPLAAEEVSYALDVQPIIDSRCVQCHSPGGAGLDKSGLDLTSYQGLMKGTKYGPIVVPGDPVTSNLNVLVEGRASPELRMPHDQRPLLRCQQKILSDWVRQGAKDN